ncbi:hypothetical protein K1719_041355 [Acacia pycnantha]|nr:hypothetical protein K1719_041355 [Acacia pycnantha]
MLAEARCFLSLSTVRRREKQIMSSKDANTDCLGWAARDASGVLSPYQFSRRTLGDNDVFVKIAHCGVCYADVIWSRNEHGDSKYPLVPGHEIAGIVEKIGSNVHRFNVGDPVGVGTYVNSCQDCQYCNDGIEVYCMKGSVVTFNGIDYDGTITKGGYSSHIVVHERYCFLIPKGYPLASAAPLLCAGLTVYSPMMRHKMNQPGMKTISGSITGGTKETQEMIDFCAANKIYPNIEVIPIEYINEALQRVINKDVKYRFVIDIENSLK